MEGDEFISQRNLIAASKTKKDSNSHNGKTLSVLFGIVSEEDVKTIRRKLLDVERNQKTLAQVDQESVSILNVTRIELAKNRVNINWLTRNLHDLQAEVSNITESVRSELQELDSFVQQYFQLLSITARVRQI